MDTIYAHLQDDLYNLKDDRCNLKDDRYNLKDDRCNLKDDRFINYQYFQAEQICKSVREQ